LFQNIDKRSGWNIDAGFASNCERTGFNGLMELTMPHLLSAIQLNHSDKIFNFHAASLVQPHLDTQSETT